MYPKIALISPYVELETQAKVVSQELDLPIIIKQAALENAILISKQMESEGIDVIISRGGTAAAIRKTVDIPVVSCDVTTFDVLLTLWQVKKYSHRVAIIFFNPIPGLDIISEILNMEVNQFCCYEDSHGVEREIERAIDAGFNFIVGSVVAVSLAKKRGLSAIPLYTSKETIKESILKAMEISTVRHKEAEQSKRIQAILDFSYEGIIFVNEKGVIEVCNPAAEKIIGVNAKQAIGRKVEELFPNTPLITVKNTGRPEIGVLKRVKKASVIMNCAPIVIKENMAGIVATFQETNKIQSMERKIRESIYSKGLVAKYTFDDIIGDSKAITTAKLQARKYGSYESTAAILLVGETGTGKELFAHAIHNISPRKEGPFVAINCSALAESLLESELFGYEEGAFTGARKGGKLGLFELAHGGTIFLDEISGVSLNTQAELLRVIQEKEVRRIGSDKVIPIDIRIIAATNEDLAELVVQGKFREDLYFRLNVLRVQVPPLRERYGDIPLLAHYFLNKERPGYSLSSALTHQMEKYRWPGNVRELKSFIVRYAILINDMPAELIFKEFLQENNILNEEDSKSVKGDNSPQYNENERSITIKVGSLKEMEKEAIQKIIDRYSYNRTDICKILGISRTTLWKKLKEFNN